MLANVLLRRTFTLHTLNNFVKLKAILTRTVTSHAGSDSKKLTSTLLVCGAAAGGAGLVFWGYNSKNSHEIEEAVCEEGKREEEDAAVESVPKNTRSVRDVDERKLQEAISKSQDLLLRAKDEYGAPGIVAAVSVNGQCLWSEGLGYSDVENRVPCTPSTVHRIASISKSFTMVAVAKLIEAGRLDIDRAVQKYVPTFPEKTWEGEKVTITTRQLLSHLSGIRHYSKDYMKKQTKLKDEKTEKNTETKQNASSSSVNTKKNKDDTSSLSENKDYQKLTDAERQGDERFKEFYVKGNYSDIERALDIFKNDPLVHKPGLKFLYSTYAWTLISAVLEGAAGKPFLNQMADIFKDLDMMYTVPDEHTPIIYNRAKGYSHNKCGRLINTPHVNLSIKWAGGGFLSTVGDLIKFGNAMLYSYQYTNKHKENNLPPGYLKPETMARIWKPVPGTKGSWDADSKYAMGWAVVDLEQTHGQCRKARHLVSHTGGAVGFSSVLLIVPPKEEESSGDKQDVRNTKTKQNGKERVVSVPPEGVVVAIIANLGATSLYKTAVKIADIFKDL